MVIKVHVPDALVTERGLTRQLPRLARGQGRRALFAILGVLTTDDPGVMIEREEKPTPTT